MNFVPAIGWRSPLIIFCLSTLLACSDSSNNNHASAPPAVEPPLEPSLTYDAEIVWTEYGIPHITAQDWGSLGYGTGYAYAQENYCLAMKRIVEANGESAKYLGGSVFADLFRRRGTDDLIESLYFDNASEESAALRDGYAAGMNRYLQETGVDNLAEGELGCRGASWVREVTPLDIARMYVNLAWWVNPLDGYLGESAFRAKPPEPGAQVASIQIRAQRLDKFDHDAFVASIEEPEVSQLGSNSYAIGGDASQAGSGILWDNPHLPWKARSHFLAHQTMGDEFDLMGALTPASPLMERGFNKDVAWAHTISHGKRFMLYELELNPENPMQYLYEGEMRDIQAQTVSAEYLDADGEVAQLEHTFYRSHIGLILDPGGDLGGWPSPMGTVLTIFLPQETDNRRPDELLRMGKAGNIAQFKEAIRSVGLSSVHTLAADRFGDAFYGDISMTPNITQAQHDQCVRGPLANALTEAGFPTLDGSDPDCALGNDPDTAPGILGFDNLASLDTKDYVANANQGFWMVNPRMILEGYPEFMGGRSGVSPNDQLFPRARQLFLQAEERLNGTDDQGAPGFSVDNIREMVLGSRSIQAEHLVDDLVELCRAVEDWSPYTVNTDSVEEACEVLAQWDQLFLIDSVGGHILREFDLLRVYVNRPTVAIYSIEFDPADPFNTPAGLIKTNEWIEANRLSLAQAVDFLVEADVPMTRSWGAINYVERGGKRYPLAGGSGEFMLNVLIRETDYSVAPGKDYSRVFDVGYIGTATNELFGNTYVSAVSWDETECPDAYSVLTYSQSSDPASPHYADGTALFSEGGWIDMPFCLADIEAQELRRETVQE